MKPPVKLGVVTLALSLAVGLIGGLWLQYRDAYLVLEVTVTADHDDKFHFYSDHGDGWISDEWSRPLKAGVTTKLYFKCHKKDLKRFKFEPLREPGEIRFENVLFTERIDRLLQPFPLEKIYAKKDIELISEAGKLPLVFQAPEGAKDPQIYVSKVKEWEFSTRRDLWDSRLPWRSLRIALVSFLLIFPITLTVLKSESRSGSNL